MNPMNSFIIITINKYSMTRKERTMIKITLFRLFSGAKYVTTPKKYTLKVLAFFYEIFVTEESKIWVFCMTCKILGNENWDIYRKRFGSIDRKVADRLKSKTMRRHKSQIWKGKVTGEVTERGNGMKHLFSVHRERTKRYDRKKLAVVNTALGTAAVMMLLLLDHVGMHGGVEVYAKVHENYTNTAEQGDSGHNNFQVEIQKMQVQLADCSFMNSTLQGVAGVATRRTAGEQFAELKLYNASRFYAKEDWNDVWQVETAMEEQNKDALVEQGIQPDQSSEKEKSQTAQSPEKGKTAQNERKKKIKKQEVIALSEEDRSVLLRIVEAEAGDQDMEGRMLVANVVLNRVNCKTEFPDNVTDVVFDKTGGVCQFSPIDDGRYWRVKISDKTKEAVHRVLCGEDQSQGALYFMARQYADADNAAWFDQDLTYLFAHGDHEFFR